MPQMTRLNSRLVLLTLLFLNYLRKGFGGAEFNWCSLTCNGYQHTMCAYTKGGPPECWGAKTGLSGEEQQRLLHLHNSIRQKVAQGKQASQPAATNMMELSWDPELATVAQRWMDQCQLGMQHDKCRTASDGGMVGQNLAIYWSSREITDRGANLEDRVRNWYDEVLQFHKNLIKNWWTGDISKYGHYTQLVWATTERVGCGVSQIKKGNKYELKMGCNYGPAGNIRTYPVYKEGKTASDCKQKSKKYDGLCSS